MAAHVLVDAGFLVALVARRDGHHDWATLTGRRHPPPWITCESVISEAHHLLGSAGAAPLEGLLERGAVRVEFDLHDHLDGVLALLRKYRSVPASLADASLVRMTETLRDPILLTTDADFRVYRRLGRQTVPCVWPTT